jgi:proteic killer suppression protein
MIDSFKHKGLKRLYEKGDRSGLRADLVEKIRLVLTALEAAERPEELDLPTFHWHALKGNRKGTYSITVRANWRITFKFEEGKAYDVNLEDYH